MLGIDRFYIPVVWKVGRRIPSQITSFHKISCKFQQATLQSETAWLLRFLSTKLGERQCGLSCAQIPLNYLRKNEFFSNPLEA